MNKILQKYPNRLAVCKNTGRVILIMSYITTLIDGLDISKESKICYKFIDYHYNTPNWYVLDEEDFLKRFYDTKEILNGEVKKMKKSVEAYVEIFSNSIKNHRRNIND